MTKVLNEIKRKKGRIPLAKQMPDFQLGRSQRYKGNENLKASQVGLPLQMAHVNELKKCAKDYKYFVRNYIHIMNVDEGLIQFDPYPYQNDIMDLTVNNRFSIVKMARQGGKTTVVAAILTWFALFNTGFKILLLSRKKDQAKDILSRIKTAYENLPKWMQQGVETWSKEKIELENGAEIMADGTSPTSGRGGTFNLVYLDEFAFVPYNVQEQFFRSAYPTISSGKTTRVLITSTPNGMNMFYKIWHDAIKTINTYKFIDVHWSDVPGRDEAWKEDQLRNMTQRQFDIEYECKFLGSINTLIDSKKLEVMTNSTPVQEIPDGEQPGLKIFEEPIEGHKYICTVDTSRGIGEDYSAFIITDITTLPYKNVVTYRHSEIHPVLYPTIIVPQLIKYNNAYVLIELNDIGSQVADIIHDEYEYPNMLTTLRKQGKPPTLSMEHSTKHERGVKTSESVKRKGCAQLKVLIETDRIEHNDIEIYQELSTFISKKKSFEAEEGKFDDFVACLILFSWATDETFFKDITNFDVRRNILNIQQETYEELPDMLTGYDLMTELDYRKNGMVATRNFDEMLLTDLGELTVDDMNDGIFIP